MSSQSCNTIFPSTTAISTTTYQQSETMKPVLKRKARTLPFHKPLAISKRFNNDPNTPINLPKESMGLPRTTTDHEREATSNQARQLSQIGFKKPLHKQTSLPRCRDRTLDASDKAHVPAAAAGARPVEEFLHQPLALACPVVAATTTTTTPTSTPTSSPAGETGRERAIRLQAEKQASAVRAAEHAHTLAKDKREAQRLKRQAEQERREVREHGDRAMDFYSASSRAVRERAEQKQKLARISGSYRVKKASAPLAIQRQTREREERMMRVDADMMVLAAQTKPVSRVACLGASVRMKF